MEMAGVMGPDMGMGTGMDSFHSDIAQNTGTGAGANMMSAYPWLGAGFDLDTKWNWFGAAEAVPLDDGITLQQGIRR